MLSADQAITLINSYYDGQADSDIEIRTTLSEVSIYADQNASAVSGGIVSGDLIRIRIPLRRGYLSEDKWQQSRFEGCWTLRVGDKILVDGRSRTILRWRDNTRRRFQPHWYVEVH